jgi:hypothetical protein
MTWREEWRGLGDRIDGVIATTRLYSEITGAGREDTVGVVDEIWKNLEDTFQEIISFNTHYRRILPEFAGARLQDWINHHNVQFQQRDHRTVGFRGVAIRASALASFKVEFVHALADRQAAARSLVERAFIHLRYSIIADRHIRESWAEAWNDPGETGCEKLGAAHLLLHGIWAFKANAEGGRTDLVLGQPLKITPLIESIAEALVLTEWKVAKKPAAVQQQIEAALRQLKAYAAEILAGFELASHRYVVVVTEDSVPESDWPQDRSENDISYRFRNIAVRPSAPSKRRPAPSARQWKQK